MSYQTAAWLAAYFFGCIATLPAAIEVTEDDISQRAIAILAATVFWLVMWVPFCLLYLINTALFRVVNLWVDYFKNHIRRKGL